MSYTSFAVNDTNAVKLWSKALAKAERDSLDIAPLMGDDDNAIIQIKQETEKGPGDKVTFSLRARGTQKGITSGQTAEGNGEALSFFADSIYIDELGFNFASRSENTIDAQRVPFNLRQECKNANADMWRDRKSVSFFNQVCGYTPANTESATSGVVYTGMNAALAPAGTSALVRQIWPSTHATDQDVTSGDGFTPALIDRAVEAARTGSQMVRQVTVGGQPKYVMYLGEGQVTALRTSLGLNGWLDVAKAAIQGGETTKNPIYTGSLGEWNSVILRRSQDVPRGVNSSSGASDADTRRAVLLGAQAAVCAYGRKGDYGPNRYRWNEELLDHKRKLEVSAWSIWGLKKAQFNSVDHGTVVVTSYSLT
jgi:N4-gp56 family major capsid protein